MKNYYEILEVNQKASKEIIEKAYRVLVKKYHPDLYTGAKQQYAEKKIKEINEAYDVLSDEFLREQYDTEIEKQEIRYRQNTYQEQFSQRKKIKTESRNYYESQNSAYEQPIKQRKRSQKVGSIGSIIELTRQLIQDLIRSKEKREQVKQRSKQDILAIILTIIVLIIIGIILWFIPFTNGWMRELLFENPLFNWIGKLFS